jgi:single-stranded-DNA-specific exonuclease
MQRGMKSYDEARIFFKPSLQDMHDPYLMQDMEKSVNRIEKAIRDNEKILVFGDYDVDGTSAVALMYSFLSTIAPADTLEYYIPDRYEEGYGISMQSVEYANQNDFSLLIALDCGIRCHTEIAWAAQHDIDVIVCDHHLPDETLPDAYAVLDPKRIDCNYPYKELSGCGVGFKLVHAIAQNRNIPFVQLGCYFDLLTLSIASDIVPITGENRVFAYFGLKLINVRPRQCIESLLSYSKIIRKPDPTPTAAPTTPSNTVFTREVTISDLVFCVGPRINAAGRMATGRSAVHLLITDQMDKILELGQRVDNHNNDRRKLDAKTTQEAIAMISETAALQTKKTIVAYHPSWCKGVIGIVASRLVEHFYKPTIVLTLSNDAITGSARSVNGFDIHIAISQCSELLDHFGGHTFAAGLTLKPENLEAFTAKFEQIVSSSISETATTPSLAIDKEIPLHTIDMSFFRILKKFSPFGPGNLIPMFMTRHVTDTGTARIVGQNHLKLSLFQQSYTGYSIGAVGFGLAHHFERISRGEAFHICYNIEINEWKGRSYLELNIKDIKFDFDSTDSLV